MGDIKGDAGSLDYGSRFRYRSQSGEALYCLALMCVIEVKGRKLWVGGPFFE